MAEVHNYGLLINGEFVPSESGDVFETYDPATGEIVGEVGRATEADVDRAIESGYAALAEWKAMLPAERSRILADFSDLLLENIDRLARLETRDSGRPISESKRDVRACARYFEFYAGIADKIRGDSVPLGQEYADYTIREPLGVTGQILPWNFPISLFGRSVAPALAAGNVSVVKPATATSLTALEAGKLALDAGFPPGVVNVVPGAGSEAGAALAGHPDVNGLSFTGSTLTGKEVGKLAMDSVTPIHLELGGKGPIAVFPDADFENAIENTLYAIFTKNAGQVCGSGERLLIHEEVHDRFVDRLAERTEALTVGPGMEDPDLGPMTTQDQYEKVKRYFDVGRTEVGEPVSGGNAPEGTGYFVEPTIFDNVTQDMRIANEEIFGPFLTVTEFSDEQEAIRLSNETEFGLVSGIFTSDLGRAHRYARDIEAGQVYVNDWTGGGVETPFGGYNDSGFGREKGLEAIDSYTQVKNVSINITL